MHSDRVRTVLTYIAANVRLHRVRRGVTQEWLAEAANVSLRFLVDVETAKAGVSLPVLVSIADALGVPPGDLLKPAEMTEIKRGRPPKVTAVSTEKPTRKASGAAAGKAPPKVTRKVGGKRTRKTPAK